MGEDLPRSNAKRRINVLTLSGEDELKSWKKVNYGGGSVFSGLSGASGSIIGGKGSEGGNNKNVMGQMSNWLKGLSPTPGSKTASITSSDDGAEDTKLMELKEMGSQKTPEGTVVGKAPEDGDADVTSIQIADKEDEREVENIPTAAFAMCSSHEVREDAGPLLEIEALETKVQGNEISQVEEVEASVKVLDVAAKKENGAPSSLQELIAAANDVDRNSPRQRVVQRSSFDGRSSPKTSSPAFKYDVESHEAGVEETKATDVPVPARVIQKQRSYLGLADLGKNLGGMLRSSTRRLSMNGLAEVGEQQQPQKSILNSPKDESLVTEDVTKDAKEGAVQDLPKIDPTKVVLARTRFLLRHGESVLPPYNIFHANSECIAVWCKTGRWQTLQTSIFLHSCGVCNTKTSGAMMLATAAAAPWLVPVAGVAGIAYVGAPWLYLKHSKDKTEAATRELTDRFWAQAEPEVFVECIKSWSKITQGGDQNCDHGKECGHTLPSYNEGKDTIGEKRVDREC